jgi:hypothetical protein
MGLTRAGDLVGEAGIVCSEVLGDGGPAVNGDMVAVTVDAVRLEGEQYLWSEFPNQPNKLAYCLPLVQDGQLSVRIG